ncbi:MAG: hypothetical protein PHS65_02790 [Arcobacteraceae bacterium]|nr:hypothetical protein [Arcobacteraceae bacterium]
MRLLIIDNDKEIIELFSYFNDTLHFEVFFLKENDNLTLYTNNTYDFVILDFSFDFGKKMLNHIIKNNPQQNIIILSEKLEYSCYAEGCDYCQSHYKKLRLLKPLKIDELASALKNFHQQCCKYYNKFSSPQTIIEILDDILSRYSNYSYDSTHKIITTSNIHSLFFLEKLLIEKNILCKIEDYNKIRILT